MLPPQHQKTRAGPQAALPSFDEPLQKEEEILEQLVTALSRGQLPEETWDKLHKAAKRDNRTSELAFAYESVAQGKRIKTLLPAALAEFYFRAAQFFGDIFGDEVGAIAYLERAIAASPAHVGAFEALDARLTNADANKKLADLCALVAPHRPKSDQGQLLRRAAVLFERAGGHDERAIEMYQALLRVEPGSVPAREALEARYTRANRHRDVARLLETSLSAEPPPEAADAARIRAKLIDLYATQLQEPERTIAHVEAVLVTDPTNEGALKMGERLLTVKALAARAAAALGTAVAAMGRAEDAVPYIELELEHIRGPKRKDPLKRLGFIRRDKLDDKTGAFESFEAALGIDPSDDEVRDAFFAIAIELGKAGDAARVLGRVLTMAKDAGARSKISSELADLYRAAGDAKRARLTHAGVMTTAGAAPEALLRSARALAEIHEAEGDQKALAEMLERVGSLSQDEDERLKTNERLAELASGPLADPAKAIIAWRNLVNSPARLRALAALEPLYTASESFADLAFILAERAKDEPDQGEAKKLAVRAAEMYGTKTPEKDRAIAILMDALVRFGADRDVHAKLTPLLEQAKRWEDVATIFEADAKLADEKDAAVVFAKLGTLRATRLNDVAGAINAYRLALDHDPTEKTSRAALERLLGAGEHRLVVADVLEPVYRADLLRGDGSAANGLLRVLDLRAQNSAIVSDTLEALGEAITIAEGVSQERALEFAGRALAEAIAADEQVDVWLRRLDAIAAKGVDAKKFAAALGKAIGDKPIASPSDLEVAKRAAEAHATAREVDKALALFRRALAFEPSSTELLARVDDLLSEQGNPKERVALYRNALEKGTSDDARKKQLLMSIGAIERNDLGNRTAAVQAYRAVFNADPADKAAYTALTELYAELEQWEKLCDLYEDHLELADVESARRTRAELAETAAFHGQRDRAIMHACALLADASLSEDGFRTVARVAAELKDTELQRAVLERTAKNSDEPADRIGALVKLGELALERNKDQAKAVDYWKQGADAALGVGDDIAARKILERLQKMLPHDLDTATELVGVVERAEDWAAAIPLYDVLFEHAQGLKAQLEVLDRLVMLREEKLHDPFGALEPAAMAFDLQPTEARVLATFERIAVEAKATIRFSAAVDEALSNSAFRDPIAASDLRMSKARVLSMEPSFRDNVIETYRRILETTGVDEGRLEEAASALEGMLTAPKAGLEKSSRRWLAEWRVAHATADKRVAALIAWGDVEEHVLSDPRRALEVYRRALQLDAQSLDATAAIARLSLAHGDVDGALVALVAQRELLEGSSKSAVEVELATILLERGERPQEAMKYVSDVLERSPGDAKALSLAARMLGIRETRARAVEVLEQSLEGAEDPAARAEVLEKLVASDADVAEETRFEWYERLIEIRSSDGKKDAAFEAVRAAAREMPEKMAFWDKAEQLARDLESPDRVAELYEFALQSVTEKSLALELGQRAVAFYEEWYEASERVVTILKRILEIDPSDLWAFDRLKLVFDAQERWEELFELYDRAIAAADDSQKVQLLEDVAQIAKDFANSADRSISYFEQLLALKPGNVRLSSALERLYEKSSRPRELITLLTARIADLDPVAAQEARAKVAKIWIDDLSDAMGALAIIEDIVTRSQDAETKDAKIDIIALLERALAVAPVAPAQPDITASEITVVPSQSGAPGRRDSLPPMVSPKRPHVRQRIAALLKEKYATPGREADLARMLEVELEAIKSPKERVRRHLQLAELYEVLLQDERAFYHRTELVLLDPESEDYQQKLLKLSRTLARLDEYAAVLVRAGDATDNEELRVDLFMRAAAVLAEREDNRERAIDLSFRVLSVASITESRLLDACRFIEPLLLAAGRKHERLEVLERLSMLETEFPVKGSVLGEAARLATELADFDRAIWAWEGRLEIAQDDVEALCGLVDLFERTTKWRELILVRKRRALADVPVEHKRADRMRIAIVLSDELNELVESIAAWRDFETEFGETDESTDALRALYRRTSSWPELSTLLFRASTRTEDPFQAASLLRELGDLRREYLGDPGLAVTAYENSLRADAANDGARVGLRTLIAAGDHKKDAVRVLLASYRTTEDLEGVLSLTEPRLSVATSKDDSVEVLREAASISETTKASPANAFDYYKRAFQILPSHRATEDDLYRLSQSLGNASALAEVLREVVDALDADGNHPTWLAGIRLRMASLLEKTLGEDDVALSAYVRVCEATPGDLEAARSTIRVAGRVGNWRAGARALVEYSRAFGALENTLTVAIEEAASTAHGWDDATAALSQYIAEEKSSLASGLVRDLEATLAAWHRDRRSDPDSAEAAYTRALTHDPLNAELLSALAALQRRGKGRPLVESLLRLSQATGGDLDLLAEAAEIALHNVLDRALAKSIFDKLLKLATERWMQTSDAVTAGMPGSPSTFVDRALKSLVSIYDDEGDVERVATLLTETAKLPFPREATREMRMRAAEIVSTRLLDPERAIAVYLVLFDEDQRDEEVVKKLSSLYETTGRKEDLIALRFRQVDATDSLEAKLQLRIDASQIQYSLGDVTHTIETLRTNLKEAPRHEKTIQRLAEIFDRESRDAELESFYAEQALAAEEAKDTENSTRYYLLAARTAEVKRKDPRAATVHLRHATSIETSRDALEALARIAMTLGAPLEAAGYLDKLREIAFDDERPDVTLKLADAFLSAGDAESARARLEDEIARAPAADSVRLRLVSIYKAQKDWRKLADLLVVGADHAKDKTSRLLRLREASDLLVSKCADPDAAIPLLETARDLDPEDRTIQLSLADAFGAAKRFDDARALLRGMIDAFSGRRPKERAPVHYHLARLDLAIGDRARALVELDAATKIDPANPEILRALAELARDDGQLERAERSYRALLTVLRRQDDSKDPKEEPPVVKTEVLLELAQIADRQGEGDRAKEILESAMEMATETDLESRRLEVVLRARGDYLHYARALERRLARSKEDSSFAESLVELAEIYESTLKKPDAATEARLRAVRIAPQSTAILDKTRDAMKISGALGKYVDVLTDLAGAAEDNGQTDLAASLLARKGAIVDQDLGDGKQAARVYEAALMLKPGTPEVLQALGAIFERLGDADGQARILSSFVESERSEGRAPADALYRLASLRLKSEDTVAEGAIALQQAYDARSDDARAMAILKVACDAHPKNGALVDLYERIAKGSSDKRVLVDALARRWQVGDGGVAPLREAVELAREIPDLVLAESLLRKFTERTTDDRSARAWALANLASMREASSDYADAILLRREAADLAEPAEARTLLFDVARLATEKLSDLNVAATVLEELHARDKTDREAWAPLLDVYRKSNEFEKLANLLGEVVEYSDVLSERTAMRLERVTISMEKLDGSESALEELKTIVEEDPSHSEAAVMLGALLEKSGRDSDLITLYERQLDAAKDKENAPAVGLISRKLGALLEKTDKDAAKLVYYASLDWAPENVAIVTALVRIHKNGGVNEAHEYADMLEKLLELEGAETAEKNAIALAEARKELGDADGAIRAIERGFARAGASDALFGKLEALYKEKAEWDKLADLYVTDGVRGKTPSQRIARLLAAARIYVNELSDFARAASALAEARKVAPNDRAILAELVETKTRSGDLAGAVDELSLAIDGENAGDRGKLVALRAELRSRLGDDPGALADWEDCAKDDPSRVKDVIAQLRKLSAKAGADASPETRTRRLRLAELLSEHGDVDEARAMLTDLLRTDSRDKVVLRVAGKLEEDTKKWDAAIAVYRRLVGFEDKENVAATALRLLFCCEQAGRIADARGGLERARLAVPENAELRAALERVYEATGALAELGGLALEEAQGTGDVGAKFALLVKAGALFVQDAQNVERAIAPLEEARSLRPTDLDCIALLADAHTALGKFAEASEVLQTCIASFKGRRARELSAIYHRIARIAEAQSDRDTELANLTLALDVDAQNGVAASELAYLAMELEQWEVATRALRAITMLKTQAPLPRALAYQHLGEIARQQGDTKKAVVLMKRAVDEDGTLASAKELLESWKNES